METTYTGETVAYGSTRMTLRNHRNSNRVFQTVCFMGMAVRHAIKRISLLSRDFSKGLLTRHCTHPPKSAAIERQPS